ncbi:hypothetical protein EVAR_87819_1 [Eumeta japonica]|uniref:Mariner Mos1 transposase n=1 Tax=Eumeta variegata TaxID=151549 RepID=A0A4C1Z5H9_EUMVA|nr:hypothetical protein EVAR_87819_1 [Eumeta japonica]
MLTYTRKQTRLNISRASLELLQQYPDSFVARFTTTDETWLHHYDPETKLQSTTRKRPSPTPQEFKAGRSAGKITRFWDSKEVIMITVELLLRTVFMQNKKIASNKSKRASTDEEFETTTLAYRKEFEKRKLFAVKERLMFSGVSWSGNMSLFNRTII